MQEYSYLFVAYFQLQNIHVGIYSSEAIEVQGSNEVL